VYGRIVGERTVHTIVDKNVVPVSVVGNIPDIFLRLAVRFAHARESAYRRAGMLHAQFETTRVSDFIAAGSKLSGIYRRRYEQIRERHQTGR